MKKYISNSAKTGVFFVFTVLTSMIILSLTACNKKDLTLNNLKLGFYKTDIEFIDCKLNEDFSPDVLNYTATVEKSYTASVYVTPELPLESVSTIKINGQDAKSGEQNKVGLNLGENIIDITVSTEGGASRSYKLNIKQEDWSKVYTSKLLAPGVWQIDDFGGFISNENMYLIEGKDKALLFDTGMGKGDLAAYVKTLTKLPVDLAITHGNRDHFMQMDQFKESIVYMSKLDITRYPTEFITPKIHWIKDGDVIDIGAGRSFEIIELPGHTMGCVVFLDRKNKIAITGDGISSGSMVYMFGTACTALDEYLAGLKKAEEKLKDLDSLTLLVGHYYQQKTPLTGTAGKQLFTDMRMLSEKVLSGEIVGKSEYTLRGETKTELKQAYYGLAGLWYNPNNMITNPASLRNLSIQTPDGTTLITRPVFSSFMTDYTASLPVNVSSIEILPVAYSSSYKSITINGKVAKSNTAFKSKIVKGSNKFDIVVTSLDGNTRSYVVTVSTQTK
jgi:glyoxylase-like metal-dependent hydrolase (beta-lactamase superfamily II)